MPTPVDAATARPPWWRSIGPALITACVVFGPGSLVISSNVGATYGYELLWLLALAGLPCGAESARGPRQNQSLSQKWV